MFDQYLWFVFWTKQTGPPKIMIAFKHSNLLGKSKKKLKALLVRLVGGCGCCGGCFNPFNLRLWSYWTYRTWTSLQSLGYGSNRLALRERLESCETKTWLKATPKKKREITQVDLTPLFQRKFVGQNMDWVIFLGASCQIVVFCLEVFGRCWLFPFRRDGHSKLFGVNMRAITPSHYSL